jgi:tetratricopeptide (TPR) repeat protein
MKYLLLLITIITFLMAGCSGGSKTTTQIENGTAAYFEGDYTSALQSFEKVIATFEKNGNPEECPVYDDAGLTALLLGDQEKGIEYLETANLYGTAGPEAYAALADHYREIDNLSKEIDALAKLDEIYFESEVAKEYRKRLFEVYIESENWEPALITWGNLGPGKEADAELLEDYLVLNQGTAKNDVADKTAESLLGLEPDNVMALEWLAEKYYWLAENRYQAEMEAYENNRTNKQYNQLLKAFETVTANFKASLTYFKKLYDLDPSSEYATFLSNIYARLDDKKMAEYYKSLIK